MAQMGRTFNVRHREHIRDIRNNRDKTGYGHRILNTGQSYSSMQHVMEIVQMTTKGQVTDTTEKYHICNAK
jgi:hypothetical protein